MIDSKDTPRTVLCMKWGTLFGPDYVNVLYNACRRDIAGPLRFICLTDNAHGLLRGVEALPIPDIGLSSHEWYTSGVWPKLSLFVPDLHGIRGRCLFIDLDMVILGGLDEMFDFNEGLVAIDVGDRWGRERRRNAACEPGTGVFAFDSGEESQILTAFLQDKAKAQRDFRNEQDFVAAHARSVSVWPDGWVISFKRHLRQPIGLDLLLPPRRPPTTAKVIAFHGTPRPMALIHPRAGFWDRFPHLGWGQVGWLRDYWVFNGGALPGQTR